MVLQLFLMLKVTFKSYYAEKRRGLEPSNGKIIQSCSLESDQSKLHQDTKEIAKLKNKSDSQMTVMNGKYV